MTAGRSKIQQEAIDRRWQGLPIRDSNDSMILVVNDDDIEEAVPGDPANCAASKACHRAFGSSAVMFFRGVAYVDLPDPDRPGERAVFRFRISPQTAQMIRDLDGGGRPSAGGYRLYPPSKSDRLDYRIQHEDRVKANASRRRYDQRQREALIKGEISTTPNGGKGLVAGMEGYIRTGTGMVQMQKTPNAN